MAQLGQFLTNVKLMLPFCRCVPEAEAVLRVDRDSAIVAFDFDERDDGVKAMIRQTIAGARRNRRHAGICGPSDCPEMAEYLVELGID